MRAKLSYNTREEIFRNARERYKQSTRAGKSIVLNELGELTGLHRKHIIVIMGTTLKPLNERLSRRRKKLYTEETRKALVSLWEASNRLCSKRLAPFLPTFSEVLEKHGHLQLPPAVRSDLLRMSPATIDRYLSPLRDIGDQSKRRYKHRSPDIRKQIPIRTFTEWENVTPGHCEIDLVAHCGTSMGGAFLYSFVLTDIATGWTESLPLFSRDQDSILLALDRVRLQFPFPLLSVDSDNGSEFINYSLIEYCRIHSIKFTRSRPYKKNDQCYIEQKNGQVIRRNVGYDRLVGVEAFNFLNDLYKVLRLYINFFQPSLKLLHKTRNGAKMRRKYDIATTPYQRIISAASISETIKDGLRCKYEMHDPVALLQSLRQCQDSLWSQSKGSQISIAEKINNSVNELERNSEAAASTPRMEVMGRHWKPTKRPYQKNGKPRWWRSRKDPFEFAWPLVEVWLEENSNQTAKSILQKLDGHFPGQFSIKHKRTLHRRVHAWRSQHLTVISWGDESLPVTSANSCGSHTGSSMTTIVR